jgi:biopolymer transport protein ExbD
MGIPEPRKTTNTSGVFLAITLIAGVAFLLLVAVFVVRSVFYRPAPAQVFSPHGSGVAYTTKAVEKTYSPDDLVVEIDQQGQTYYKGQAMPLEQIRPLVQDALRVLGGTSDTAIRAEEGCPFEYVEGVIAMYKDIGMASPRMATIPPRRSVVVTLDAEGKAAIDGEPVENAQEQLRKIAAKHHSRAKVTIQADPKCPFQFVAQLSQVCRESGFGEVQVESTKERMAERTE